VGIGAWWLVFFTRAKVKQQFVPVGPLGADAVQEAGSLLPGSSAPICAPTVPARPLSLTVIAWFLLVGCLFVPLSILLKYPAPFFTKVLTSWLAALYYLTVEVVQLYAGIGLLRLRPLARRVAVGYYAFFFVNMAVFYLAPGGRSRMLDMMQTSQSMFPWMRTQPWQGWDATQLFSTRFLVVTACFGLLWILLPLYFLITRKQAFERAAAPASDV